MFTFKTAVLFWLMAASVPLITSFVNFCAPLSTEPLAQRIPISVHGAFIAVLCIGAVLVGMVGSPRPELGETFRLLLLAPIALVVYSLWHFRGKRAVHFLQGINLLWLAFAFFLGGMGVSVSGYDRSNPPYMDCPSTARA